MYTHTHIKRDIMCIHTISLNCVFNGKRLYRFHETIIPPPSYQKHPARRQSSFNILTHDRRVRPGIFCKPPADELPRFPGCKACPRTLGGNVRQGLRGYPIFVQRYHQIHYRERSGIVCILISGQYQICPYAAKR